MPLSFKNAFRVIIFSLYSLFCCIFNKSYSQKKTRVYLGYNNTSNIASDKIKPCYSGDKELTVFITDTAIYDQLAKKIPPSKLSYVLTYGQRAYWPKDFSKLSYEIAGLVMYYMCDFIVNGREFTLIEVPAAENNKLSGDAHLTNDIYLIACNYFIFSGYNIGGNQQNKASAVKLKDKEIKDFIDFRKMVTQGGLIDTTQYFKTTVPVISMNREDAKSNFLAAIGIQKIDEETRQLNYALDKAKKESEEAALNKKKKDSLNKVIDEMITKMVMLNKPFLDLYKEKRISDIFTKGNNWRTRSITSDSSKNRSKNDLRGPAKLHYLQNTELRFYRNNEKGGLNMLGDVSIYVRDEDPYDPLFGSRTITNTFIQRIQSTANEPFRFISDPSDRKPALLWDLANTPLSLFNPKINEYGNEMLVPELKLELISKYEVVSIYMKTNHYQTVYYMPAEIFELYVKIVDLSKYRDTL